MIRRQLVEDGVQSGQLQVQVQVLVQVLLVSAMQQLVPHMTCTSARTGSCDGGDVGKKEECIGSIGSTRSEPGRRRRRRRCRCRRYFYF